MDCHPFETQRTQYFNINKFCLFKKYKLDPMDSEWYASLNPFQESPEQLWHAYNENFLSTTLQDFHPNQSLDNSTFSLAPPCKYSHQGQDKNIDQSELMKEKKGIKQRNSRNAKPKQSSKHNFNTFLVRQIRAIVKGRLQMQQSDDCIDEIKMDYLRLVKEKLKQSRKSLIKYIIAQPSETQLAKQFQQFLKSNRKLSQTQAQIKECKQYLLRFICQYQEIMLQRAQSRQIEDAKRRQSFTNFVQRFISDLKNGKISGKDQKQSNKEQEQQQVIAEEKIESSEIGLELLKTIKIVDSQQKQQDQINFKRFQSFTNFS